MQENFDIAALERDRDDCVKGVEIAQSVERLMTNRDFKRIVLEGYFKDEAVRLVHLKQDPAVQSDDAQRGILKAMDAIGSFAGYLANLRTTGSRCAHNIEQIDQELEELRQEALNV